jgi:hypothetical protein
MNPNPIRQWLRKTVILGTPLALGIVELWHPKYISLPFYDNLLPIVNQWLIVHLLQLPLFGLLALAVYLLLKDLQGLAASIGRMAMGIFVVFYTAFDSIVGVATGILIGNTHNLSPDGQATINQAIEAIVLNPIVGDTSVISILGGVLGWIVGIFSTAIALYRSGAPLPPVVFLGLSFIFASHPRPTGTLGMAFFFIAVVWLELFWQRNSEALNLEEQFDLTGRL